MHGVQVLVIRFFGLLGGLFCEGSGGGWGLVNLKEKLFLMKLRVWL